MKHFTITIAREFGSLGRPIAKKMSELLKIEYYDRDIVEKTAKKMNETVSKISNEEEIASNRFFNMKFPLGTGTSAIQDKIFVTQAKIINELSDKQSCIIVGRCSDYILQNRKNCIHIFIYAPLEERLKNCVDILNMEYSEAKKMIIEVDKARRNYHQHYAGYLPSDYRYKDISINSSLLGIEGTAKHLSELVRDKIDLLN